MKSLAFQQRNIAQILKNLNKALIPSLVINGELNRFPCIRYCITVEIFLPRKTLLPQSIYRKPCSITKIAKYIQSHIKCVIQFDEKCPPVSRLSIITSLQTLH